MGWRGQENREKDREAERRLLSVSERYAWQRIAWILILILFAILIYGAYGA